MTEMDKDYQIYTLTLDIGRTIIFQVPEALSEEDYKFMLSWIERLGLVKVDENESNRDAP